MCIFTNVLSPLHSYGKQTLIGSDVRKKRKKVAGTERRMGIKKKTKKTIGADSSPAVQPKSKSLFPQETSDESDYPKSHSVSCREEVIELDDKCLFLLPKCNMERATTFFFYLH